MKKSISSIIGISLFTITAYGSEPTLNKYPVISDFNVKLGAYAAFEAGCNKQNHVQHEEKAVSANKKGVAFYNDTALYANISNKSNDVEYGAKIVLVPTAKRKNSPEYNGSHIFIKSEYGHMELGSPIPAAQAMMISDGSIPTKYIKNASNYLKQNKAHGPSFLTSDGHFLGDSIVAEFDKAPYSAEPSRTINYYTPKLTLGNVTRAQIGISYTPDSSNTGAGSCNEKTTGRDTTNIGLNNLSKITLDKSVKDAVTAGIVIENEYSPNSSLKIALTGEYGKSVGYATEYSAGDKELAKHKLANLRSYNIGGELTINDITLNACYGNLGKSFTTNVLHKSGNKSHYYNAGIAYKYNETTTKLSYFGSDQYKNKVDSIKLNISHVLAKGLKPYAEVTSYRLKGKPEFYKDLSNRTSKGIVGVVGLKLTL